MQRLADALPVEQAASRWIVSDDPDEHVEKIKTYLDLGFRHLVFHAPGPDQQRFLALYGEQVLPRLRALGSQPLPPSRGPEPKSRARDTARASPTGPLRPSPLG